MFEDLIQQIKEWAVKEELIDAIALVGSYARGSQRIDSDIDLILITSDKQRYINYPQIFSILGDIDRTDIEFYGECTSIRVWYKSGMEVEYGIVSLVWIDLPLDAGTKQVLSNGYRILVDKKDLFAPIVSVIPQHT